MKLTMPDHLLTLLGHDVRGIVLAHNHPSGICRPSADDVNLTRQLMRALQVMKITVLDHLIFTEDDVISLREQGIV